MRSTGHRPAPGPNEPEPGHADHEHGGTTLILSNQFLKESLLSTWSTTFDNGASRHDTEHNSRATLNRDARQVNCVYTSSLEITGCSMRRKVLAATAAPALWLLHRDDHALGETEQPPAPHCCLEAASQVATPQQLQQRQQKGELPATLLALGATTLEALPRHLASFLTLHVHADSGASSNFSTSSTSSFHATAQQLQPRQQSAAAGAPPRLPPLPLPTAFRAALSYPLASYMGLPYASSPLSEEQLQQLEAAALAGWDGPDALQVRRSARVC